MLKLLCFEALGVVLCQLKQVSPRLLDGLRKMRAQVSSSSERGCMRGPGASLRRKKPSGAMAAAVQQAPPSFVTRAEFDTMKQQVATESQLVWNPHASDSALVANLKDIVEQMAALRDHRSAREAC